MVEIKVRRIGNSLGVTLPKEVIRHLHATEGETLYMVEDAEGGYRLTAYDPAFAEKMAKADEIMGRYRNTLRALSK